MTEIKLHKNEIEYIKMGVESNAYLGNDEKLAERILKKLNQALTIPVVVKQFCECKQEPSCRIQDNKYYCNTCDKELK